MSEAATDFSADVDACSVNGQYLTFLLGGEEYAVDILDVQEIKGWEVPTLIPNAPHYMLGVINLRGTVVPIVDLRHRFGFADAEYGATTVVVVLSVRTELCSGTLGIVVDAVSDVYYVHPDQIQAPTRTGSYPNDEIVRGLAVIEDKMLILLDTERLYADCTGRGDLFS